MPILANAKKALRSSKKKAIYNRRVKSKATNALKKMRKSPTIENLQYVYSAVDKAVKRKIFHKNKAARLKSQVAKLIKA